jgi:hypothetical protein
VSGSDRTEWLSPEAPDAYTYADGLNLDNHLAPIGYDDQGKFCKSCQVYKAPYEIESATVEFDSGGNDVVKLVFKTRFQTHESAPSSFSSDVTTWDTTNIRSTQDYRTDDNGICEFFLHEYLGLNGSWKIGDSALATLIRDIPDNPFGSIMPTFFFTRLMPKPYEDGNNTVDPWDSRMTVDPLLMAEIKLKAWCEGAVDAFSSQVNICGGGSKPFDYTFENLCFDAFRGSYIGDFAGGGHGPLVNTITRSTSFNQIAAAVDLLNKFRIEGLDAFRSAGASNSLRRSARRRIGAMAVARLGLRSVREQWDFQGCPPSAAQQRPSVHGERRAVSRQALRRGDSCAVLAMRHSAFSIKKRTLNSATCQRPVLKTHCLTPLRV